MSSFPISRFANATKATIDPTLISPRAASTAPSASTRTIATVAAARVSTVSTPHQVSTGYCADSSSPITARIASSSAPTRT